MNGRAWRALTLAWPLLGLTALWGWSDVRSRQGTEWLVPIAGYDPRDLLRGHYVLFQYQWPGLERPGAGELCLHGRPPIVDRVTLASSGRECVNYARAEDFGSYAPTGLQTGRLYVPQDEGRRLERQLMDPRQQAFVRVRLREDGHLTPLALSFRRRPAEAAGGE